MRRSIRPATQIGDRLAHPQSIRTKRQNALLRTLQLRRRHHFHGFRDFLGFLNGIDLPFNGLKAGHTG